MKKSYLTVAGTTIELIAHNAFPAESYFRPAPDTHSKSALRAFLTRDSLSLQIAGQPDVRLNIPSLMRDSPCAPIDFIRKYLAYFASLNTQDWDLVHGAGLAKGQGGILILGRSGSGKSTICRSMTDYKMVEDDSLLLHHKKMYWICKSGMAERGMAESYGEKSVVMLQDSVEEVRVKIFFFLSKRLEGGKCYKIKQTRIRRWLSLPDFIAPRSYLSSYLSKPPIPIDAPGYVIGSQGNLPATLQLIHTLAAAE